jgi:two-component system, chemotaxis family, chemotaxis protein CheY
VGTQQKATILLVEDDEDIAEILEIVVPGLGYQLVTAPNGAEALALLRSGAERPQLILLDLMMPEMNGWEFRAEQLRDPSLRDIPVVVMTGMRDADREAAALRADGLLAKPIDLQELRSLLARYSQ